MKKHLLTGVVILMPIVLTLMVIFFLIDFFTTPFISVVSHILIQIEIALDFQIPEGFAIPLARILALILLFLFILLLGALTRWFLIRSLIDYSGRMISRIPFIKTVYTVSKDIFSALFPSDGKKIFQYSALVPFPFPPSYSLGFRAGEVTEEIQKKTPNPLVSVFVPTVPHPISGFLFFVPEKEAHKIPLTTEESVKFLVSCGMLDSVKDLDESN